MNLFNLFLYSGWQYLRLIVSTFIPKKGRSAPSIKRIAIMLVFIPVFGLVQLINWIGLFLDELLYRDYRQVDIRNPIFILGVPRSGTTFLHRILSEEQHFTTFSTWECFFAPSVTQRKFLLALGHLDSKTGAWLRKLLTFIETRLLAGLDGVHTTRMDSAEEDYFVLMPVLACFILILPFPQSEAIWKMGTFDRDMPPARRRDLMQFYKRCLQKHLYVHGSNLQLLSKNAAFASLSGSLCESFPDARFLCCLREPIAALPSQLSAIQSGIGFFDAESQGTVFKEKMIELFLYYYDHLLDTLPRHAPGRYRFVSMKSLQKELYVTVRIHLAALDLPVTEDFEKKLRTHDEKAKQYVTRHEYTLSSTGLSAERLELLFRGIPQKIQSVTAINYNHDGANG